MWGTVQSASMFETVLTYTQSHFQAQAGLITVDTKITPGLINKVDTIYAVWAESGYVGDKFGLYAGVRPYVVSGSINASIPTDVDFYGNIKYTTTNIDIMNPVTTYLRTVYSEKITNSVSFKISGMVLDNNQYRLFSELRYNY